MRTRWDRLTPWRTLLVVLGMALHVFTEVVTAHEAVTAYRTDEALLTRVGPPVSRQLIGACKLLVTILELTHEWLLS